MAKTQIRGNTQIIAGTITNTEVNAAAAIASTKLATWSATRDAGSNLLSNLANPVGAQDAATKSYVDGVAQGLDVKKSCRVATTANITLSGTQTIDGIALSIGDRVLVKNQTTGSQNGIYDVASGAWARSTDSDTVAEFNTGAFTFIEEGTVNGDTGWVLSTNGPITLGTTALVFVQFSSAGVVVGGAGITQTGNTLDIVCTDNSITVNADDIFVKRDAAGAIGVSASGIAVNVGSATGLQITSNSLGIKLNGSSLTLGASGLSVTNPTPTFIVRETPAGAVDGSNVTFTLANTPTAGSEQVFLNGILQEPGAGNDYTISGGTITYLTAPITGDRLRVSYRF